MDTDTIKSKLSRMERQRRALELRIRTLQRKELVALPRQLGFDSVDGLILALVEHASASFRARCKAAGLVEQVAAERMEHVELDGNGVRVKFSPELRARIKKELEAGEKSVAMISREYGPSHPTIMGWKREWGMTRPRPKRAPTATTVVGADRQANQQSKR
jgi:transposase-like protein